VFVEGLLSFWGWVGGVEIIGELGENGGRKLM